jgi:hypothetical protein
VTKEYNEALRQRGSLTVWFTDAAIAAWKAAPRTTPGGQPHYSDLAITTALTLRAVFHLPLRQGLIGSVLQRLGLDLLVPDFSTLSRRAQSLELPAQPRATGVHLLVDSSGLMLGGPGEWRSTVPASGAPLHIGFDAVTGRIVASILTDVDDASQVEPLLDQIAEPVEVFLGDGGYDRTGVYTTLDGRYPDAVIVVPPRADAVLSATADTPSATATSRRSLRQGGWLGSATAAIIKGPVSRASSHAGSRSSGTGCASTATRRGPPLSQPRSSTECSTLDARSPSASHDQQRGMGPPLPLPPPCNTLSQIHPALRKRTNRMEQTVATPRSTAR